MSAYPTRTRSVRASTSTNSLAGNATSSLNGHGAGGINSHYPPGYNPNMSRNQPPNYTPSHSHQPLPSTASAGIDRASNHPTRTEPIRRPPIVTSGPLPYFLAPQCQTTRDPTFSLPPSTQGLYTTYPSRLRSGVTNLIQPENITGGPREREQLFAELDRELFATRSSGASTPRLESPAPPRVSASASASFNRTSFSGRRLAGRVNYAEKDSDDDDESDEDEDDDDDDDDDDDVDDDDDDDDATTVPLKRGPGRPPGSARRDSDMAARAGKLKRRRDDLERGWTWLGDRVPADRVTTQRAKPTRYQPISEELLEREKDRPELLVPITIDFDVASPNPDESTGIKVKDRFLWNANEPFLTPLDFATVFCEDIDIPVNPYAATMAELIQSQIEEAQNVAEIDVANEEVNEDDVRWDEEEGVNGAAGGGVQEEGADGEGVRWKEADCRVVVNIDVQIFTCILRDRIEWDLSSHLSPISFSKHYCAELGLSGEAIPLVAHAIHDELIRHKRDALDLELFASTHPHEQAKWERGGLPRTTNRHGAKALASAWRDWWEREEFGPVLVELSTEEMEKRELERTREARRLMRTLTTKRSRR